MSTPIVMLQGWGLTPGVWDSLRAELGEEVVAPQLLAGEGSLADWADRLLADIPPGATLIGWSLGAMLAMSIAARAPQHVSRLVLLAATPRFVKHDNWQHGLDAQTTRAFRDNFRRDPARTLDRFIALQALGDSERTAVTNALRANLADPVQHAAALSHGLRLLEESDLRNALPPVSMRCLLIHGEQDALMPHGAAEWLAHRWSRCETFMLPETGHATFLSQPQIVAARIKQFIHAK